MLQNSDFYRHIEHVLGDEPALQPSEILRHAAGWFSGAHPWEFLVRPFYLSLRGLISITGATYTDATLRLVKTGAFADYSHLPGDRLKDTGGTGVVDRVYEIASRIDDDTIELVSPGLGADADGATDVSAVLPNDSMELPEDFMGFPGGAHPIRARGSINLGVHLTSHEALTALRSAQVEVTGASEFAAVVTQRLDRSSGLTQHVLDHYPGSSISNPDAFFGHYRAHLVIDVTDDLAPVPLPNGRPALELALIQACRAFAMGWEEGGEVEKPSLEALLLNLQESRLWKAATKEDGLTQSQMGPLRGGIGRSMRGWYRGLSREVDAPT